MTTKNDLYTTKDGLYSVVNGKLMVETATARVEVPPMQAANTLNRLRAALAGFTNPVRCPADCVAIAKRALEASRG